MARLSKPRRQIINQKDFEHHPVWTWDDEDESILLPLAETNPDPEEYWYALLIKAKIQINTGEIFDGCIIGNGSFYAFGIFIRDDGKCIFNKNLPDLNYLALEDFSKALKKKCLIDLFPVHYKSSVRLIDGKEISGVLDFPIEPPASRQSHEDFS